jgi:polyisoprenoid-binding protein YceI
LAPSHAMPKRRTRIASSSILNSEERPLVKMLFRHSLAALGIICLAIVALAAAKPTLIKEKSKIEFVGSKPSASHKGGFKNFDVDGNIDWDDLSKSSLKIEIDATSLWSDDGGLTSHLKNRDFFNVEKFPKIQFEATSIKIVKDGEATVSGKLTLLDQAIEMSIPCKFTVTEEGLIVSTKFTIDRTKWGMNYGQGRVNNDVEISVTLVFATPPGSA